MLTSFFAVSVESEYEVREKPTLHTWMQGGLDYITLQYLNTDGIRTIGSVLGQSIALDYYVRQVRVLSTSTIELYKALWFCSLTICLFSYLFFFRLMELLLNLLTSTGEWRKLEPLQWNGKSFFNWLARQIQILLM